MVNSFKNGHLKDASSAHRSLLPIMKALFASPNPTPVKAALNMTGVNVGGVRLPLVPLNTDQESALRGILPVSTVEK